jgi:hypothetical protein
VGKQAGLRGAALVALLAGWIGLAPGTAAQTQPYPYPQQGYYPTDPYSQYYGQYGYGGYGVQQYGNSGVYGPSYSPYGYGYGPYGGQSAYNAPYAYQGYGTALNPYYGAPAQPPGYYGTSPAYQPPYYGATAPYQPPGYYGSGSQLPAPYGYYGAVPPNPADPSQAAALGLTYGTQAASGTPGFVLTATLAGPNFATLSWTGLSGAVSYAIYQSNNGAPLQFASTSTATQANVPLGQGSYAFAIHAIASGGSDFAVSNVASPVPGALPSATAQGALPPGPGVPSPNFSSVTSSLQSGSLFFGTQITVTLRDAAGVPVVGKFVSLLSTRAGDNITPANGSTPVTDGGGRALFMVRPVQPGQATFTAYVDSQQVGQTLVNFQ